MRLGSGQGLPPEWCVIQAELGDRGRSAAPLKMSGDRRSLHVESVTYKISTAQDERAAVLYEGSTRTAVSQNATSGRRVPKSDLSPSAREPTGPVDGAS